MIITQKAEVKEFITDSLSYDKIIKSLIISVKSYMENVDQTNYEQPASASKIRTPASLFSKTSVKSPGTSVRMHASPSSSQVHSSCENHPRKEAVYYTVIDDQQLLFCEKCALTLAFQGQTITRLQTEVKRTNSSSHISSGSTSRMRKGARGRRESEMQQFLSELKDLRGTIQVSKGSIHEKLIQSEQFYGQQLEQINDYFTLIVKSLQLQKHKCYNHILKERQEAEQSIRDIDRELQSIDQDVTKILMDIEDNMETVLSIEEDMYQMVIGQYKNQQEQFHRIISGLLVAPIEMRKIDFQGVPQSIYNMSDLLIQNSLQNKESQQYRLADSLSPEDLNNIHAITPRDEERDSTPIRQISEAESLKFSFQAQKLKTIRESREYQAAHYV